MSESVPVQEPAGVNVCRSTSKPGICDQHGVDYGECAEAHRPTPLNPALAERLEKYGLARCVYAAAHDSDPWSVDETDGGYGDVRDLIAEDWNVTLEPLALALGMPDDSDYAVILQRVTTLVATPRVPFDARDRIERALREFNAPGAGQIAHHIMLALSGEVSS